MARKVRIEYSGAFYHIINRGNYRSWIFERAGTRKSFLKCLTEVCEAKGWRVHAWCLMSNHYHLLIETPEPNLVIGMRWSFGVYDTCLESAGGLADKPKGRRLYRDYLQWLTADDPEQKRLGFEKMTRGWAKGSKEFKKAVSEDLKDKKLLAVREHEAAELREILWERTLQAGLTVLEKSWDNVSTSRKGTDWKIALARYLREIHLVPHIWIAEHLKMGKPSSVQSWVSRHRKNTAERVDSNFEKLKNHGKLDWCLLEFQILKESWNQGH